MQVEGLKDVKSITAGRYYSLVLKNNGTIWAWGYNNEGQLGNGTAGTCRTIPEQVKVLSDVSAIVAGNYHSLAIKTDGTVWAWGANTKGQLGDGTKINRFIPTLSKDITAPTIPTNLTAVIEDGSVILSWSASTDEGGIAGYEVFRNDVRIVTVTDTTFSDTGISEDKIYVYKVRAYDASGNISEAASVVLNDNEVPSTPTNLKISSNTITTVSLEWTASEDNLWVEGYEIYRNGVKVGDSRETSFTDMKVPHNSSHVYTVKAYDKFHNLSEESNSVSITTGALKQFL